MIVLPFLLLGVILFLSWIYYCQKFTEKAKKIAKVPSVEGFVPIFGHILLLSLDPVKLFTDIRNILGKRTETCSGWGGTYPTIHIVTAEDAEMLMTDMEAISKGTVYHFMKNWLGTGLLISDGIVLRLFYIYGPAKIIMDSQGNKWHNRRKLLTPAFHFTILQKFIPIFNKHSSYLIDKLKEECKKPIVNIIPLITDATLSTICETSMGLNLQENIEIKKNYFQAVHSFADRLVERVIRIYYHSDFIYNLSNCARQQSKIVEKLHKFSSHVIKVRENEFMLSDKKSDEAKQAMLDLLLAERDKGNIDTEGIQEEVDTFVFEVAYSGASIDWHKYYEHFFPYMVVEILYVLCIQCKYIKIKLLQGHDTVAIAICFSLFLLAIHKDIQDKVVEELNEIFGESKREANYTDLQNMKYLECCLKETMRLYPSVPLIGRLTNADVPLTKHVIPANTEVFVHIYNVHRDTRYFPDPEKYDPDRFLPENSKGRHPFAFVPFSAGPRNCIGQKYAMLELKTIVSTILRNFILEKAQELEDLKFSVDLVLRVKGPMNIKFIPRP